MSSPDRVDWQRRIDAVWADPDLTDAGRIRAIDDLASEFPQDDPLALYERGGARDSAGLEEEAVAFYERALPLLDGEARTRCTIQYASTIRNLGRLEESRELLRAEYERQQKGSPYGDAAAAFYALALASTGDAIRAASVALEALAPHLPRYTRSVTGYARELVEGRDPSAPE